MKKLLFLSLFSINSFALTVDKSSIDIGSLNLGNPFSEKRLVSLTITNDAVSEANSISVDLIQSVDSDQGKMFKILRNTCSVLSVGDKCSVLIKAQPVIEGDMDNPSYSTPEGLITASFSVSSSQGVVPFTVSSNVQDLIDFQKEYPIDIKRDEALEQKYSISLSNGESKILCPAKDNDTAAISYCESLGIANNEKTKNCFYETCSMAFQVKPDNSDKLYEIKLEHKNHASSNYWGDASAGDFITDGSSSDQVCDNTVNGEMCVLQVKNLTINEGHTLTTKVRRRGLIIYVDGDANINGKLSMTARGANGDPAAMGVHSSGLTFARNIDGGSETGDSLISGTGSVSEAVEAKQKTVNNGRLFNIPLYGANGGARTYASPGSSSGNAGDNGVAGQSGGGAAGHVYVNYNSAHSGAGGRGTCFSGGSGGGATFGDSGGNGGDANNFGGIGGAGGGNHPWMGGSGGAGNGGGPRGACGSEGCPMSGQSGTGGLLILMVKGNLNIGANGVIESKGSNGGTTYMNGGGSGGGSILILHAGEENNLGTITAEGGNWAGSGSIQKFKIKR